MTDISLLITKACEYDCPDSRRIAHFMKVYAFAKTIAEAEKLPAEDINIIEAAAVLHDIGIHNAEKKYNSSAGKYQELEGPAVASKILSSLGAEQGFIDDVNYLIAHHHTYTDLSSIRLQILVESDFLVNAYEDEMKKEQIISAKNKIFKTKSGIELLKYNYGI